MPGALPVQGDGQPVRAARSTPDPRARRDAWPPAAIAEIARLEQKYSRYRDDSLTLADQRAARATPRRRGRRRDRGAARLRRDRLRARATGRFDITSGVLRRAWDFRSGRLPEPRGEIAALLPRVGWEHVRWRRPRLVLPRPGMQIDFGGLVKEYAADRVAELARRLGAPRRSSISAATSRWSARTRTAAPWRVGVRDPLRPRARAAALAVYARRHRHQRRHRALHGGRRRRYGHILDPRTGWPVEGPRSVTRARAATVWWPARASTIAMLHGGRRARAGSIGSACRAYGWTLMAASRVRSAAARASCATPRTRRRRRETRRLPDLDDLPRFEAHAQTRRIVEPALAACAVAAEEHRGARVVRDDVLELEVERALRERDDLAEEGEDRAAARVRPRVLPAGPGSARRRAPGWRPGSIPDRARETPRTARGCASRSGVLE